ncbi:MAG: hypothetical protein ABW104_16865 [Candidatus Thiodiazotropha sp. 6PLUC2]
MKKLYKLKTWFSLSDAAERLSASLEEKVSVKDVLQLAIEGELPISCDVRDLPARRYPPHSKSKHSELPEEDKANENYEIDSTKPTLNTSDPVTSTESNVGYQPEEFLRGTYKIELEKCSAIRDWLYGVLSESDQEIQFRDGFFLTDEKGDTWQVLEYMTNLVVTKPNGKKVTQSPQYQSRLTFPSNTDLVVQRKHIEIFEESLRKPSEGKAIHLRTETSYLNIIAALYEVIKNGIPNTDMPDGRLGPISGLKSKAMLVNTIAHRYESVDGLSVRNLNQKLLDAKKSLENSY